METNEVGTNLTAIIKRLEVIKNLISLEEIDEIDGQIAKLNKLNPNEEIELIIVLLSDKAFGRAVPAINSFINKHRQISIYADPELDSLKVEAKTLEAQLNMLSNEKADVEKIIHEFGVRHNKELGELIIEILEYRKEKSRNTPEEAEAEEDYNKFSQEYETSKEDEVKNLSQDELKELKRAYRNASKLCHPDMVSEEQKELADKLFTELNLAYEKNDLTRVNEILKNLQNGNLFINKSDSIGEVQLLRIQVEKLRLLIKELKGQLELIQQSDAYTTIISIADWDEYFSDTKKKLQLQLTEIRNGQ